MSEKLTAEELRVAREYIDSPTSEMMLRLLDEHVEMSARIEEHEKVMARIIAEGMLPFMFGLLDSGAKLRMTIEATRQ